MAIEYGRLETTAVGARLERAEVDPHRVARSAPRRSDGARPASSKPVGRRSSSSTTCTVRDPRRRAARSAHPPLPRSRAPRRPDRAPASRTIASSRLGSARKLLAEPAPTGRRLTNRRPAPRSPRRSARAPRSDTPRSSASDASATSTTFAGSFGLPRTGCGARNGRVGLDQQQLVRAPARAASRSSPALRVGDVAGERAVPAPLGRLPDPLGGAEQQCRITVTPSASRARAARTPRRARGRGLRGRGRGSRAASPRRRAIPIWASNARALIVAVGAVAVEVETGLADRRARAGARRAPRCRRRGRVVEAASPSSGAGRRRRTPPGAPPRPRSPRASTPRRARP